MKRKIWSIIAFLAALSAVGFMHGCGKSDGVAPGAVVIYGGIS
jgi:hypothetical protein